MWERLSDRQGGLWQRWDRANTCGCWTHRATVLAARAVTGIRALDDQCGTEPKSQGEKGQGTSDHTCLVLLRHKQPSLSSRPQQRSPNHLHHRSMAPGKPSLLGIPACNTNPPETTATSGSANLIAATTVIHEHTQCKQRQEHPVPRSLIAWEVSKGEDQRKSYSVLPPHRTVFVRLTSSSCWCTATSMWQAGTLGETTLGHALLPSCQPGASLPISRSHCSSLCSHKTRGYHCSPKRSGKTLQVRSLGHLCSTRTSVAFHWPLPILHGA